MQNITLLITSTAALMAFLHAEDASQHDPTRLTSPVADGSPPEPEELEPRIIHSTDDVWNTKVSELGDRLVISHRVAPIDLPPLPEKSPAPALMEDVDSNLTPEDSTPEDKTFSYIFIGASTYEFADSPDEARSFVQLWIRQGEKPVSLWTNANFLWLGGFSEFATGTRSHSMILASSAVKLDRLADFESSVPRREGHPVPPPFKPGEPARYVIVDGSPTQEELAPLEALLALLNQPEERERLKSAHEGRLRAAEERAAFLKANPPEKKDIILRHWRMDEAGRNGIQPKPALIR